MIINPIMPIWLMIVIAVPLVFLVLLNNKRIIERLIIIVLLCLINIRVMLPDGTKEAITNNVDVLLVVDNSISMIAEDYRGNNTRLSGVKENIKYIMNKLPGSSFALINFNNISRMILPFINDPDIFGEAINDMKVRTESEAKGTTLNIAYEDMEQALTDIDDREDVKVVVLFLSDGEITSKDNTLKSFAKLKDYIDGGAVLGYGTTKGGRMKADSSLHSNGSGYIVDKSTGTVPYPIALSKIDENNLRQIASDLGVEYVHMEKNSDIDGVVDKIKTMAVQTSGGVQTSYKDTYYIFSIILLIILGFEFIHIRRSLV